MLTKKKKLTHKEQKLASRFIAEEVRTRQYPREQAIAIGISRAKAQAKKTRHQDEIASIMAKYE